MKKFKLIFTAVMLLACTTIYAQDLQTKEVTQTYNGVTYKITFYMDYEIKYVTIKNMSIVDTNDFTVFDTDYGRNAENSQRYRTERSPADKELLKRQDIVRDRVNKIAKKFFSVDSTCEGFRIRCYYDVKTSNYVGISDVEIGFLEPSNLKERVTLEKLHELHELLLKSNINAGTWTFRDPTKKYFII